MALPVIFQDTFTDIEELELSRHIPNQGLSWIPFIFKGNSKRIIGGTTKSPLVSSGTGVAYYANSNTYPIHQGCEVEVRIDITNNYAKAANRYHLILRYNEEGYYAATFHARGSDKGPVEFYKVYFDGSYTLLATANNICGITNTEGGIEYVKFRAYGEEIVKLDFFVDNGSCTDTECISYEDGSQLSYTDYSGFSSGKAGLGVGYIFDPTSSTNNQRYDDLTVSEFFGCVNTGGVAFTGSSEVTSPQFNYSFDGEITFSQQANVISPNWNYTNDGTITFSSKATFQLSGSYKVSSAIEGTYTIDGLSANVTLNFPYTSSGNIVLSDGATIISSYFTGNNLGIVNYEDCPVSYSYIKEINFLGESTAYLNNNSYVCSGGVEFGGESNVVFLYFTSNGQLKFNGNNSAYSTDRVYVSNGQIEFKGSIYPTIITTGKVTFTGSSTSKYGINYIEIIKPNIGFKARLSPYNVVPISYGSDTYGTCLLEFKQEPDRDVLYYNLSWDYPTVDVIGIEIRGPANEYQNNGKVYDLILDYNEFTGTEPLSGSVENYGSAYYWLKNGLLYIEIISSDFYPLGDCRGQIYACSGALLFNHIENPGTADIKLGYRHVASGNISLNSNSEITQYYNYVGGSSGSFSLKNDFIHYIIGGYGVEFSGSVAISLIGRHVGSGGVQFTESSEINWISSNFNYASDGYCYYSGTSNVEIINPAFRHTSSSVITFEDENESNIITSYYIIVSSGYVSFNGDSIYDITRLNLSYESTFDNIIFDGSSTVNWNTSFIEYTSDGYVEFGGSFDAYIIIWDHIASGGITFDSSSILKRSWIIDISGSFTLSPLSINLYQLSHTFNGELSFSGTAPFAQIHVMSGGVSFSGNALVAGGERYWIASTTGNWNDTGNWSMASGGSPGADIPSLSSHVYFDGNGLGDCIIDEPAINCAAISVSSNYSGSIDTTSSPRSITLNEFLFNGSGTLTIESNTTLNINNVNIGGNGTITDSGVWNVSGSWKSDAFFGSYTGSSDITLSGVGTTVESNNNYILYNLEIDGDLHVGSGLWVRDLTLNIGSTFTNNNSMNLSGDINVYGLYNGTGNVSAGSTNIYKTSIGDWSHSGTWTISGSSTISSSGYINSNIVINSDIEFICDAIYNPMIINGNILFSNSNITNSTDAYGIQFNKLIYIGGSSSWTKGAGSFIKLSGNSSLINFNGLDVDPLIIDASGGKTLTGNITSDSIEIVNGFLGINGRTILTHGDFTVNNNTNLININSANITVGGDLNLLGTISNNINLESVSHWTLTHNGENSVCNYVRVARCDASGGFTINSADGTNTDLTGNINWLFPITTNGNMTFSGNGDLYQTYNSDVIGEISLSGQSDITQNFIVTSDLSINFEGDSLISNIIGKHLFQDGKISFSSDTEYGIISNHYISQGTLNFYETNELSTYYWLGNGTIPFYSESSDVELSRGILLKTAESSNVLPVDPYAELVIQTLFINEPVIATFYGRKKNYSFEEIGTLTIYSSGFHIFRWYDLEYSQEYEWYASINSIITPIVSFTSLEPCDAYSAYLSNGFCCSPDGNIRYVVKSVEFGDAILSASKNCN